jgi:hypothetical protein
MLHLRVPVLHLCRRRSPDMRRHLRAPGGVSAVRYFLRRVHEYLSGAKSVLSGHAGVWWQRHLLSAAERQQHTVLVSGGYRWHARLRAVGSWYSTLREYHHMSARIVLCPGRRGTPSVRAGVFMIDIQY